MKLLLLLLYIKSITVTCIVFLFEGIRDWLKSLRLHKYTKILLEVKYEELLELTDEDLEKKGVTLGARGKILKNVGFMKDRPNLLNEICINLEVSFVLQYFLFCNKNIPFDFDDELKIGDVRYRHLT